jgi:two-component system NtrC family sensor kinase
LKFSSDALEGQLQLKNIKLETDISKDLPELHGNPVRLRQLLDNLLGNAVKYSPDHTTIRVSLQAEDSQIILSVADQGAGIHQSEHTRIFEKFYRAKNVSEKVGGSGLGLAIVKSIVEAHQGRIWVESSIGKGSTFFVVLPASLPDEESR